MKNNLCLSEVDKTIYFEEEKIADQKGNEADIFQKILDNYLAGEKELMGMTVIPEDTESILEIKLEELKNIFLNSNEFSIFFEVEREYFINEHKLMKNGFNYLTSFYIARLDMLEEDLTLEIHFEFSSINWKNIFSINEVLNFFENNSYDGFRLLASDDFKDSPYIYCSLDVDKFKDKTLRETINEVISIFLEELDRLEKLKNPNLEIFYKIDKVFKTGIKQYITYFNDYVINTKGLNINFELESHSEGLIIKLDKAQDIHKIEDYFIEYMDFLRCEKVEGIKPKYEITKTDYEITFEKMELQSEINNLKNKCNLLSLQISHRDEQKKMLEEKINYHENMNEFFKSTINNMIENSKNFSSLSSGLVINNTNTSTVTSNINIETKEIENFQNNINEIKKLLKGIDNLDLENEKNEIEKIDDEILDVTNIDELKGKKKYFNLYKRLLKNINDENSTLNNTIKATEKGKKLLNKVRPLIPAMLSNIDKLAEFF